MRLQVRRWVRIMETNKSLLAGSQLICRAGPLFNGSITWSKKIFSIAAKVCESEFRRTARDWWNMSDKPPLEMIPMRLLAASVVAGTAPFRAGHRIVDGPGRVKIPPWSADTAGARYDMGAIGDALAVRIAVVGSFRCRRRR